MTSKQCWQQGIKKLNSNSVRKNVSGVPWWLSRLMIQCCHCCSSGLIPGPGKFGMPPAHTKREREMGVGVAGRMEGRTRQKSCLMDMLFHRQKLSYRELTTCHLEETIDGFEKHKRYKDSIFRIYHYWNIISQQITDGQAPVWSSSLHLSAGTLL